MSLFTRLRTLYRSLTDLPGEEEWREVTARLDATVARHEDAVEEYVGTRRERRLEAERAEILNKPGLSRMMMLIEIDRALKAVGHSRSDEFIRELEKRLPSNGRYTPTWDKDDYDRDSLMAIHPDYWFSESPRATHIQDLGPMHLIHIIKMIQNGYRKNGETIEVTDNMKAKLPALMKELEWRGLSLSDLGD